jgi:hypothetical protein
MRHQQAALGHHLHQVSQTELESKILAHAQDDDSPVEVAPLEQFFGNLQLAHCRPQPTQLVSVADRTAPFAPEPRQALSLLFGFSTGGADPYSCDWSQ